MPSLPPVAGTTASRMAIDRAPIDAEVRALVEGVEHLQRLDPLTGLLDRGGVLRDISRRLEVGESMTVLFVSLDWFRAVNELYGYAAGDEVLCQVADRLQRATHARDAVARVGGDEFAVVVHGVEDGVAGLVEQLERTLSATYRITTGAVRIGVSIGAGEAVPGSTAERVLADAEGAMRETKATRRTGVRPAVMARRTDAEERLRLVEECRTGLLRNEFVAHFQPVVDLRARRMVRVEALVRWQHPRLGLLRPDAFMGVMEAMGYQSELGLAVLDSACEALGLLSRNGLHPALALKFSMGQLTDATTGRRVAASLKAHDIDMSRLVVEISDRSLSGRRAPTGSVSAEDSLVELHHRGARLCLGNFGTGSTSLGNVRRFPLGEIKVDRSIVSELGMSPTDRALADLIVRFGRALDLVVGAEGVETAAQLEQLAALGYDQAQGYFVGVPMSVDDLVLWSWG